MNTSNIYSYFENFQAANLFDPAAMMTTIGDDDGDGDDGDDDGDDGDDDDQFSCFYQDIRQR